MSTIESDVCSHVRVVVRVRPENEKEKEGNYRRVVHVVDKHMLVFDPKAQEVNFFQGKKLSNRDISKKANKDLTFVFDGVFDENSTQMEVFQDTTKIVLDGVLNGYNCTVLAYGATGSGKTHTMLGSPAAPGVMFLTMLELYERIELLKDEKVCQVALSYLEVYNEQIRDLLGGSKPLAVCEDAQKGVIVQNLTLHQPKSAEEILQMLDYGNKNRTQHPTDINATSSRSHAVLQIYLRQQDVAASISQNVRLAKMCLIDLAGSERASATNARGARLREGANINRSLLALGNVINALADPKSKKQHIPYRNSKLTRLLKDSLGGNCRTIMIAAVSPSSLSFEDTYNTLKYANRAKDIKSSVKSNVVSLDSHISQYVKICEQQKKEIIMLKDKLAAYEEQKVDIPAQRRQSLLLRSNQQQSEIQRFRDILKCLFTNREEIRKEFLNLEMRQKENELKTSHQQQRHNQVHMMCSEEKAAKATCKRDQRIAMLKTQYLHIVKKKEEAMKRFEENTDWLHRVENEMRLSNSDGQVPEELCKELKCCHLQMEVNDLKTQIQYMMHLASLQEQENKHAEKLLNAALPVLFQENNMLRAARLLDDSAEADFKKVENLVQRERAVVWADQPIVEEIIQNGHPDISLVMAFPNLTCSPSTPCSAKQQNERLPERPVEARNSKFALVRPFDGLPSDELKENIDLGATDATFQSPKRTRRKLMVSPLAKDRVKPPNTSCSHKLDDSLTRDLLPIVYSPDTLRPTSTTTNHVVHTVTKQEAAPGAVPQQSLVYTNIIVPAKVSQSDCILNETTEIDMNSTVILHKGTDVSTGELTSDVNQKPLLPCTSTVFQRPVVSACANNPGKPIEKPSYMSMTSAAARKRKLLSDSSCNVMENKVGLPTAKRIRQDIFNASKALRVRKVTVGEDFGSKPVQREEPRTLSRSVSEGNLIPAAKRTFTFMKSKPFMRIAKK